MADLFENHAPGLSAPAADGAPIVPSDAADLPVTSRAIWIGAAGDLAVELAEGGAVVLAGVPGGTLLPLRARAVRATGTTADALVALW